MTPSQRSPFISSRTRRQMARRRPSRSPLLHALVAVIVLAAALGAFVIAGGGL